jgi:hypothetical protein
MRSRNICRSTLSWSNMGAQYYDAQHQPLMQFFGIYDHVEGCCSEKLCDLRVTERDVTHAPLPHTVPRASINTIGRIHFSQRWVVLFRHGWLPTSRRLRSQLRVSLVLHGRKRRESYRLNACVLQVWAAPTNIYLVSFLRFWRPPKTTASGQL